MVFEVSRITCEDANPSQCLLTLAMVLLLVTPAKTTAVQFNIDTNMVDKVNSLTKTKHYDVSFDCSSSCCKLAMACILETKTKLC